MQQSIEWKKPNKTNARDSSMKKAAILLAFFGVAALSFRAGTLQAGDENEGKVTGKAYSQWNYDLTDDSTITKRSAFEISRVYFGYKNKINDSFSREIMLDVERVNELTSAGVDAAFKVSTTKDERYEAFLKTAYLEWKDLFPKTTLSFGMVPYFQFGLQEKFWGNRYIYKSLMDQNKFGHSADLGICAKIKPSKT